jgi:hypothetical protein
MGVPEKEGAGKILVEKSARIFPFNGKGNKVPNKYAQHSKIDEAKEFVNKRIYSQGSCIRKKKYTHEGALGAIGYLKASQQVEYLRTYLCPQCHAWHLTSKPKKTKSDAH